MTDDDTMKLVQAGVLDHADAVPAGAVSNDAICPNCQLVVPPASDEDRANDVMGPQPPGWRLCWCGWAWTPEQGRVTTHRTRLSATGPETARRAER
jgi:hypothetical protein